MSPSVCDSANATSHSVKEDITIVVSGTRPTTGYAVGREILLENTSL
jgi:hypothetical protein